MNVDTVPGSFLTCVSFRGGCAVVCPTQVQNCLSLCLPFALEQHSMQTTSVLCDILFILFDESTLTHRGVSKIAHLSF